MQENVVRNAADKEQVEKAREKSLTIRELELMDLKKLLELRCGRNVLWRFLEHAGAFESVFAQNSSIYYKAGLQDFGHYLMDEISAANQEALFVMMRENKKEKTNV